MKDDYIKRSDAIKTVCGDCEYYSTNDCEDCRLDRLTKIPAADVWPLQAGENITENNPVDEFVCSECGIILEDWSRVEIDDDDGERTNHEYVFRYCPNCGKPMK